MDKIKILIVEDEGIVAKDLETTLIRMGHFVVANVISGEEAIQAAAKKHPDLILMDIVLKGRIDGVETTRKILELVDIPVIYVTAYTEDYILERAIGTIPYAVIIKPVDTMELKIAINLARERHEEEKKKRQYINQLESFKKTKTLSGFLPICAGCKRIRDVHGDWKLIETYITERCEVKFSHGLCPNCARNTMEEIQDYE